MSRNLASVFVFLTILTLSCKETIVYVPIEPQNLIVGSWYWFESDGGGLGYLDTTNFSRRQILIFDKDSIWTTYTDGHLSTQRKYSFEKYYDVSLSDTIEVLVAESSTPRRLLYVYSILSSDTLKLEILGATDAGYSKYFRIE